MFTQKMDEGRIVAIDQAVPFYMEKLRGIYASEVGKIKILIDWNIFVV